MTLRSWLDLLVVPLALVGIGLLFEMQQDVRQRAAALHQQGLAEQRAQDEALQAYFDEVSRLILEEELTDDKVQTILRARTITVLGRLDPRRGRLPPSGKTALMQFLVEADLVQGRDPTISLRGAALRKTYLYDAADDLSGATLRNADLRRANLSGADLTDANLTDVSGITNEELEQQAETLEGATMPNGQKYEE
jgi:uncharacterized protein YjbI with pentapeptide repeats